MARATTTTAGEETPQGGAVPAFAGLESMAERRLAERLASEVVTGSEASRLRAARRLVEVAQELAAPALIDAMGACDPTARSALMEQLGWTGGAEALRAAREGQADDDALVRAAAVEAVCRLAEDGADEVVAALVEAIEDPDPRVRRRAALCAASARRFDPGPLLTPLLSDPDRHARRLAAIGLGSTRDPEAALALVGSLLDGDEAVRRAAGMAAAALFGPEADGIADLPALQRGRAVARLRAHVSVNLARLAPDGRLELQDFAAPALHTREPRTGRNHLVPQARQAETWADAAGVTPDLEPGEAHVAPMDDWAGAAHVDARSDVHRAAVAEQVATALVDARGDVPLAAVAEQVATALVDAQGDVPLAAVAEQVATALVDVRGDVPLAAVAEQVATALVDAQGDVPLAAVAEPVATALVDAQGDVPLAATAEQVAAVEETLVPSMQSSEASRESMAAAEAYEEAYEEALDEALAGSDVYAEALDEIDGFGGEEEEAEDLDDVPMSLTALLMGGAEAAAIAQQGEVEQEAEEDPVGGVIDAQVGFRAIEEILRAALRGVEDSVLAGELEISPLALGPIVDEHLDAGRIVRRGKKLFLP